MMYKSNHYAVPFSLYSAAYQLHFFKTGQKNHKHNTKKKKTKPSWLYVEPVLVLFIMNMCGIIWKLDFIRTHLNVLSGLIS